jgi:hypothetical protein
MFFWESVFEALSRMVEIAVDNSIVMIYSKTRFQVESSTTFRSPKLLLEHVGISKCSG